MGRWQTRKSLVCPYLLKYSLDSEIATCLKMLPLQANFHKSTITTTLPFSATLMKPLGNVLYHLFSSVNLILNSIQTRSYELKRKVALRVQVTSRKLLMLAQASKALPSRRIHLLMWFHILKVVTMFLSLYDVQSSLDLSMQSLMRIISVKFKCFVLEPNSHIQQLFSMIWFTYMNMLQLGLWITFWYFLSSILPKKID